MILCRFWRLYCANNIVCAILCATCCEQHIVCSILWTIYCVQHIMSTILWALYYVHYIMCTVLCALYCASHTPTSVGTWGRCTMHCMGVSHPENCSFCHNLLGLLFNQGNGPSLVHAVQCQPNKNRQTRYFQTKCWRPGLETLHVLTAAESVLHISS